MTAFLAGRKLRASFAVSEVQRFLHAAGVRVGQVSPAGNREDGNLVARVYNYWQSSDREWRLCSDEGERGHARERAAALMLDVDRLVVIDRHEPRLRKDLSRTIHELREAQKHRMAASAIRRPAEDYFSQNEPIVLDSAL